ncbi:MAG TPA: sigma-70 family RNA polymerase sigma factor [Thermoanaerobaculia bacterium]|jgi:RNA polymerase sigma factor (sigma-70 family)|nr:sigma-70 family RNA polymerase sigma factor [Thermoanaerobaculia bacterium]
MQPPSRIAEPGAAEILDLLKAARPKLCRLLASLDVPVEDSEDLIHDSLVALLDHWQEIVGVVNPEAWLLGTLRITILQYWRRRKRQRRMLLLLSRVLAASEPPPQERQDAARDVAALTADLSPRDCLILGTCHGDVLKPREAAEILGCQPDSVRKLSRRALAKVRRQLPAPPAARSTRSTAAGPHKPPATRPTRRRP